MAELATPTMTQWESMPWRKQTVQTNTVPSKVNVFLSRKFFPAVHQAALSKWKTKFQHGHLDISLMFVTVVFH